MTRPESSNYYQPLTMGKINYLISLDSTTELGRVLAVPDPEHRDIVQEQDLEARKKLERKLVLKLDLMFLPFLSFMYLFSSLDRSSLG